MRGSCNCLCSFTGPVSHIVQQEVLVLMPCSVICNVHSHDGSEEEGPASETDSKGRVENLGRVCNSNRNDNDHG